MNRKCLQCRRVLYSEDDCVLQINDRNFYFCSEECMQIWLMIIKRCLGCGRPRTESDQDFNEFADGRVICHQCLPNAVLDNEKFSKCVKNVQAFYYKMYNWRPPCNLTPRLCDAYQFREHGSEFDSTLGLKVLRRKRKSSYCDIYVIKGHSPQKCEEILAHELAHDMMSHKWEIEYPYLISEGFAQYMAYKYNEYAGASELNERMLTEPPDYDSDVGYVYYEGPLLLLSMDEKGGYKKIVEFLGEMENAVLKKGLEIPEITTIKEFVAFFEQFKDSD